MLKERKSSWRWAFKGVLFPGRFTHLNAPRHVHTFVWASRHAPHPFYLYNEEEVRLRLESGRMNAVINILTSSHHITLHYTTHPPSP